MKKGLAGIFIVASALLVGCTNNESVTDKIEEEKSIVVDEDGFVEDKAKNGFDGESEADKNTFMKDELPLDAAEYIWTEDSKEAVSVQLDFPLQDGSKELTVSKDSKGANIEYKEDAVNTSLHFSPKAIKEVGACDYNFDGVIDVIIVGVDEEYKEAVWLFYGVEPLWSEEEFEFDSDYDAEVYLNEKLSGDITLKDVKKLLISGKENGEFESYQEAYKAIIKHYETIAPKRYLYNLIYLDADNIPELVTHESGSFFSVYAYSNGMTNVPIHEMGGRNEMDYVPYMSCGSEFWHNSDVYGRDYFIIKDREMIETYSESYYFECDDPDCPRDPDVPMYTDHTGQGLSDAEIASKIDAMEKYKFELLQGEYTADEIEL